MTAVQVWRYEYMWANKSARVIAIKDDTLDAAGCLPMASERMQSTESHASGRLQKTPQQKPIRRKSKHAGRM